MQREQFEVYKNLFLEARNKKNYNDIVVWSTEMLKMDDSLSYLWANRGEGLAGMGHHFDAILNYDRALLIETENDQRAILYSNKGAAYWDMWNAEKALSNLYRAIDIQPMAQTYMTLGNVFKYQGLLQKAISAYRSAVELDPEYADGHLVLGMALLKSGALQEGWKEYEWRFKTNQLPARKLKCPQWNGQDLTNKMILIYGEQGLGDIIQFGRYARVLANKFPRCKIIVEGRPSVKRLLETVPEIYSVINAGDRLPPFDYAVPMLTLAGLLTPTINSIPAMEKEYLLRHSDIEVWADRLKPLTDRLPGTLKVGVCWAGMAREAHPSAMAIDMLRSTSLNVFAPLTVNDDIAWVSLQKGKPAEQIKTPPCGMTIGDFTEDMHDFYETACAAANCDLVISVDTAVAHAAASVGVPTWLLSRWDGCWRWFGDRSHSPWYPTLTQFVQPSPGDWDGMMINVAKELVKLAKNKNSLELDLTLAK